MQGSVHQFAPQSRDLAMTWLGVRAFENKSYGEQLTSAVTGGVVKAAKEKGVAEESSTLQLGREDGLIAPVTVASDVGAVSPIQIRDRIKELRRVRARELLPHPKNWRRHPQAQVAALRGLLDEIGYADAVLARELPDGRLMLIDGHLRKDTTPDAQILVLVLDVTEAEAEKILATHDPLAAMAESDSERIKSLVATIQTNSAAVQDLLKRIAGDHLWEILHPEDVKEVEVFPDRADELRVKWGTETGQLWQVGPHRVLCGDSRERSEIARLWSEPQQRARLIWTDAPYGVRYADKNRLLNRSDRGNRIQKPIANDHLSEVDTGALFRDALAVASEYCEPGACVYATVPGGPLLVHFITALEAAGFGFRSTLVWIKNHFVLGMSDYHFRHELILYGWLAGAHLWNGNRSQDSVFEVDRPHMNELHPTAQPVELIARMIVNSSRPGELVYDPFGGSGSTIVAAHQLGRIGHSCEIDPAYVAVQLERLSMLGLEPQLVGK
jgi:site-specific DNA-methyltransferase (adenine-specific)